MPPKSPATLDAKETATLLKEWKDEFAELTREVADACGKLDKAREAFEKKTESFWCKSNSRHVLTVFALFFILLAGLIITAFKVDIGPVKIEKYECKQEINKPQRNNSQE